VRSLNSWNRAFVSVSFGVCSPAFGFLQLADDSVRGFRPPLAADKTDVETGPLAPPNFQEQQELVQQAIEQTRREAEAAVKRNADILARDSN